MKLGSSLRRRRGRRAEPRDPEGNGTQSGPGLGPAHLRLAGMALGVVLVGLALGYLFATRVLFPAPPPPGDLVPVPDLRGATLTQAKEALWDAGLTLGVADSLRHPSVPQGTVLGQSPLPGQLSPPEAGVDVTFSMGPDRRAVPDVVNLRADRARTILETSGFRVSVDSVEASQIRGEVVAMEPEPGTDVAVPTDVRLEVSLGPPTVEMPALLGLTQEQAEMTLDSLGLVVSEVRTRFRFGLDQGTVIEQSPAAGTEVEQGSAVILVVGRRAGGGRNIRPPGP